MPKASAQPAMLVGRDTPITFFNHVGRVTTLPAGFVMRMCEQFDRTYSTLDHEPLIIEFAGYGELVEVTTAHINTPPFDVDRRMEFVRNDEKTVMAKNFTKGMLIKSLLGDARIDATRIVTVNTYRTNASVIGRLIRKPVAIEEVEENDEWQRAFLH